MKKIVAILAVMCLGLVMIPNLSMLAEAETYNLVVRLDDGKCEDTYLYSDSESIWRNDTNYDYADEIVVGDSGTGDKRLNGLIRISDNYLSNNTVFISVMLELYLDNNASTNVNVSVHALYSSFNETEVTWNNRTNNTSNNGLWETLGGYYDPNPICIVTLQPDGQFIQYNITTIYEDWVNNGTRNLGLLLTREGDDLNEASIYSSSEHATPGQRPRLNITYSGGSNNPTSESTITKDTWNLKGFMGDPKLASVIYSEISNCKALVYKNATSGYYYTYAPTWGILEDYNLIYGDGLFILTTTDTTWDHT